MSERKDENLDRDSADDREPDWLDAMMREDGYIDDGGFTARVMDQLPPSREVRRRRRNSVVIGSAALGSALSLFVLPGGEVLTRAFTDALAFGMEPSAQRISMVSIAVLALFGAGTAALARGTS